MNERKLIAQYGFLLTGPLATAWNIPGKIPAPMPGRPERCGVPKGAIWTVGDSAEEQKMIRDLGRKLLGDGNDPEVVERIEGELAAEETVRQGFKVVEDALRRTSKMEQMATSALQKTTADFEEARVVAELTLKETLQKWMRFDPPNMRTETKAKVEKAVKMYMTEPKKHSEAAIAQEFSVNRKTVSIWFKMFFKETGFRVVTHRRHESVRAHIQAEEGSANAPEEDDESGD